MSTATRILIASRTQATLQALQSALNQQNDFEIATRLVGPGEPAFLLGTGPTPDIVVLRLAPEERKLLEDWLTVERPEKMPALIVIGTGDDADLVRIAFRGGARDYIAEPVRRDELVTAIRKIVVSLEQRRGNREVGQLSAFVGAAGGVGTSLVAANVAHMLAAVDALPTMLVDLDLMFAPLAHYLDLKFERGLAEAVAELESVDEHALAGYGAKHASGLRLLGARPGSVLLTQEMPAERFSSLLQILQQNFAHVLIDTPHHVDPLSAQVFSMSSNVFIVLQQSVLQVRNAVRLTTILRNEIGLPKERIRVIVNRANKNPPIELNDIRNALDGVPILSVANHFKSAIESLDTGVPLLQAHPNAPITRGLLEIRGQIAGTREAETGSFLRRALPSWIRGAER